MAGMCSSIAWAWLGAAQAPSSMQRVCACRASCTRSANLLACVDADGNAYSVNTVGNTIYLRGFEKNDKRYWAQTNSRFGQMTFFTGIASDGEAWVGYTRRVGWTTINRFSSSGGSSAKFTCSRLTGC